MAYTVEIVLIVVLVVILGIWFFTSRNQCAWGSGARKSGLAPQKPLAPARAAYQKVDAADSTGHVVAQDIPEYKVPIINQTGQVNVPSANQMAGFQELQVPNANLIDTNSGVTNFQRQDLFSTFSDAPAGVSSTMWPTTADNIAVVNGDDATANAKAVMPGGAQTVQEVKTKYDAAARNQSAFQLDKRAYASALSGTKRRARQVGEQAGANFNLFAEYLGADVGRPVVNCDKIGSIMLPEWHPCWDILNQKIEAEDQARATATGSASMAFRTMSQRI